MLTSCRLLRIAVLVLVLCFVIPQSAQGGRRRRVMRLSYWKNRQVAARYLKFDPFAVTTRANIRRRQREYLRNRPASTGGETLALRSASLEADGLNRPTITDGGVETLALRSPPPETDSLNRTTSAAAAGDEVTTLGIRPPIRVPYRPPLRSPYRPPVPW